MGVYERSEKTAHGAPVFVKKAGDTTHFLFRHTHGTWRVTDDEKTLAKGSYFIKSSKASELPSEAGLSWKFRDGKTLQDDPTMACTAVRQT